MPEISIIYTTISTYEAAETLAKLVVKSKLAACVNIIPNITSVFHWEGKGKIETTQECTLLFKTSLTHKDNLLKMIIDNHPYSLPAIFTSDVHTTESFFDYIQAETF